eukprot:6516886-Pyramimonas_sp.AAC.2
MFGALCDLAIPDPHRQRDEAIVLKDEGVLYAKGSSAKVVRLMPTLLLDIIAGKARYSEDVVETIASHKKCFAICFPDASN